MPPIPGQQPQPGQPGDQTDPDAAQDASGPQTITITADGQGGFSVDLGDGQQPVPAKDARQACDLVEQALGVPDADDQGSGAADLWKQEAAKRGPDGRQQPGARSPMMSL